MAGSFACLLCSLSLHLPAAGQSSSSGSGSGATLPRLDSPPPPGLPSPSPARPRHQSPQSRSTLKPGSRAHRIDRRSDTSPRLVASPRRMSGPARPGAQPAARVTSSATRVGWLRCLRPWLSFLGVLAPLLLWRPTGAAAQMVADSMAPSSPDWRSAHTLLPLVLLLPTLPLELAVLVLLYRRRRLYPIAGRGSFIILVCGVNALVGGAVNCMLMVAYPRGVPCGIYVLLPWMFVPLAAAMLVRGWLLIFRLEIQTYLTELAWRQDKMARLRERGLILEAEAQGEGGAAAATSSADSSAAARSYAVPSDPLAPPSFSPPSIPGHAFITRRWLTEPRWVLTGVGLAGVGSVVLIVLVSVFDHDVQLTDEWRKARGLPDDGFSSHYDPFLEGPRCFAYSIKNVLFMCVMLVAIPLVSYFAWRIRLHAKRTTQRALEQAAFDEAMRQQRRQQQQQQQQHSRPIQVRIESPLSPSSSPSAPRAVDAHVATEMDELSSVKMELLCLGLLGAVGTAMSTAELAFAYEWVNLHIMGIYLLAFGIICVPPLYFSYVIQRKHMQLMQRTRQNSQSGGSGGGAGAKREGRLIALVPHHRPLYRLKHVLHDVHAYPVLLKFLQKEFSSENALFYLESRRFGAFCRSVERVAPGWTSSLDDDGASGSGPSRDAWSITGHGAAGGGGGGGGGGGSGGVSDGMMLASMERIVTGEQGDMKRSPMSLAVHSPPTPERSLALTVLVASRAVSASHASPSYSAAETAPTSCALPPAAFSKRTPIHIRVDWPPNSEGAQSGDSLRLPGATSSGSADDRSTPVPPKRALLTRASSFTTPPSPSLLPVPSPPPAASRTGSAAAQRPAPPSMRQLHSQAGRARSWALQLYADYIQPNGVYQVNIANDLGRMLAAQVRQLQQWQPTPLDSAGEPDYERAALESAAPAPPPFPLSSLYQQTALSIFNLMEADSFRRFLLTADFQSLLQRADDAEMERLVTQAGAAEATHALLQRADQVLNDHSHATASSPLPFVSPPRSPSGVAEASQRDAPLRLLLSRASAADSVSHLH